jgi:predicted DNA-binding transcriptional regulator YafY
LNETEIKSFTAKDIRDFRPVHAVSFSSGVQDGVSIAFSQTPQRAFRKEKEEKAMSFVTTQPEALSAAAASLAGIGSAVAAQNAAAGAPTTGVVPPAADEVSALTAAQFAAHAQLYQAVSAQAQAIHDMFVSTLCTSAGSYAATEAANAIAAC